MMGRTHTACGLAGTSILMATQGLKITPVIIGVTVIGSLMPDIDSEYSLISRKALKIILRIASIISLIIIACVLMHYKLNMTLIFNTLIDFILANVSKKTIIGIGIVAFAIVIGKITPHRSFAHSLLGLITFGLGIELINNQWLIPFTIGYILHISADMLTNSGVELLYPLHKKISLKITNTGSIIDTMICAISIIIFSVISIKSYIGI